MRLIPGYSLWLGHVGDARDTRAVLSAGITAIVDLAASDPPITTPRELVYCRFPLADGVGNPAWILRSAISTVSEFLCSDVPTLVFCSAGMSRSLVIAAAAVAVVRSCSFDDALALVTQSGPADISPGLLADVRGLINGNHFQH